MATNPNPNPNPPQVSNSDAASLLDRIGDLLEVQHANPYRVRAYHDAAAELRRLERPFVDILRERGTMGLEQLPSIGGHIARALDELARSGHVRLLDRLEGEICPEHLFATLPGVGPDLAGRIHKHLGVDTYEDLEAAAHDGRLEAVPGFGRKRAAGVRAALQQILSQRRARVARGGARPSVELLLDIDAAYRGLAAAGRLRTIAPRRFNPNHIAWLPIYHTDRDGWSFTVMFSNTALAHKLRKTDDWVVVFYDRGSEHGQHTVVTEYRGALSGKRVVRGRERECALLYDDRSAGGDAGPDYDLASIGEHLRRVASHWV